MSALESITVQNPSGAGAVNIQDGGNSITVDGSISVSNFPATQNVDVTSSVLPTGASTSALQITGNSSLSNIDTKTPPLGQTVMANSTPITIASDQSAVQVGGNKGSGTSDAGNPVKIGGVYNLVAPTFTSGNRTDIQTDINGNLKTIIQNGNIEISNDAGNPVPVSGTVTSNIGTTNGLALDASVNSLLKPASTLAAVTSITNTVTIKADTAVNQTNSLKVDGSATTQPISAVSLPLPSGAATSALQTTGNSSLNSIDTKQTDGTARTRITDGTNNSAVSNVNPAYSSQALVVRAIPYRPPTYSVTASRVALGNQKSLFAIQNTGTSVVRISKIYLVNETTTAVTGVVANITLQRIASFSAGTALISYPHNTVNVLPGTITMATGATFTSESAMFRDTFWSNDEWAPGTSDVESTDHTSQELNPWYKTDQNEEGITLIQNQGLHVKCNTNTIVGTFTITVVFTVEDV